MPTPVIQIYPLKSWSFSRYADHKKCPYRFKLKVLERREEPKGEALDRGIKIHDAASAFIRGDLKKLPKELASFAAEFKELAKLYKQKTKAVVIADDDWAFRRDWTITHSKDWDGCWLRAKVDAAHSTDLRTMHLRDWKTGKLRQELVDEYLEQLEFYALCTFMMFEWVQEVTAELCFLDLGVVYPPPDKALRYNRGQLPKLKAAWEKKAAIMFKDKMFPPRANAGCRWCHFRRENGGPCKF